MPYVLPKELKSRNKFSTLPDDLKKIAEDILAKKFDIPDVEEKPQEMVADMPRRHMQTLYIDHVYEGTLIKAVQRLMERGIKVKDMQLCLTHTQLTSLVKSLDRGYAYHVIDSRKETIFGVRVKVDNTLGHAYLIGEY